MGRRKWGRNPSPASVAGAPAAQQTKVAARPAVTVRPEYWAVNRRSDWEEKMGPKAQTRRRRSGRGEGEKRPLGPDEGARVEADQRIQGSEGAQPGEPGQG